MSELVNLKILSYDDIDLHKSYLSVVYLENHLCYYCSDEKVCQTMKTWNDQ